tara:strand:+ start:90 stop:290 length:201 start_codon:yes stop_codon:yes gene_type:complete
LEILLLPKLLQLVLAVRPSMVRLRKVTEMSVEIQLLTQPLEILLLVTAVGVVKPFHLVVAVEVVAV